MSELTIAYSRGKYTVTRTEGLHKTTWDFTSEGFSAELLRDILGMEQNSPLFLQPGATWDLSFEQARRQQQSPPNPGRNAVPSKEDTAAKEAELALRNGGSALAQGLALEAPVVDDAQLKGMALPGDYVVPQGLEKAWKAFKEQSEQSGE